MITILLTFTTTWMLYLILFINISGLITSIVFFSDLRQIVISSLISVIIIFTSFLIGYSTASDDFNKAISESKEQIKQLEQQSLELNQKLVLEQTKKEQEIKEQQVVIKEKIVKVKEYINRDCKVSKDTIDLHNEATR